MLSKSKSIAGTNPAAGYKKKKAPPRPPPPSSTRISSSQSFHTSTDLFSQKRSAFAQQTSYSVDVTTKNSDDLIVLSTPPGSPSSSRRSVLGPPKPKGPPDFMYRVGASVFYVKSELKNSSSATPTANPFSPPRPSAQSILSASPVKLPQQSARYGNVPATAYSTSQMGAGGTTSVKHNQPTIIKTSNDNNNSIKYASGGNNAALNDRGSFRSSSGSSDWSDFSQQSHHSISQRQGQQPRYGNVPVSTPMQMTWDEPPAHNPVPVENPPKFPIAKPQVVQMPTIIKPQSGKPSLLPKPSLKAKIEQNLAANNNVVSSQGKKFEDANDSGIHQRNYYDDPPDSDFDEDDDFNEDSYVSAPMPNEPPPPPPTDVAVDEWVDTTQNAPAYHEPTFENQNVETDRAYAIALYDYIPDAEGDLPLQAGDLVYLYRRIDDAWLYGQCAGYEGMFPSNFVNIVVPLAEESASHANPVSEEVVPSASAAEVPYEYPVAQVLYQFDAETDSDITLTVGEEVKLYGRLNDDWLYGELNGSVGQFPAAFVSPVPSDLPTIGNTSS